MFKDNGDMKPFASKVWLASPTMHGEEQKYVNRAFELNWITTAGENVNEVERITAEYIGVDQAVALSAGTAALHLAMKLAGEELYGKPKVGEGTLAGLNGYSAVMYAHDFTNQGQPKAYSAELAASGFIYTKEWFKYAFF